MNDESSTLELRDAAIPDALMPGYGLEWWWLVAGIFALIVLLAVVMLRIRGKAQAPSAAALRETAFREAMAALSASAPADARAAAVLASLAVRKYLSVAAEDPALFETHEEFLARHNALNAFKPEARAAAESGFTRLAALKYAPQPPDASSANVIAESRTLLQTLHHGFAA
jgi:hypothetical protein